jgi:hypothetical protein
MPWRTSCAKPQKGWPEQRLVSTRLIARGTYRKWPSVHPTSAASSVVGVVRAPSRLVSQVACDSQCQLKLLLGRSGLKSGSGLRVDRKWPRPESESLASGVASSSARPSRCLQAAFAFLRATWRIRMPDRDQYRNLGNGINVVSRPVAISASRMRPRMPAQNQCPGHAFRPIRESAAQQSDPYGIDQEMHSHSLRARLPRSSFIQ